MEGGGGGEGGCCLFNLQRIQGTLGDFLSYVIAAETTFKQLGSNQEVQTEV